MTRQIIKQLVVWVPILATAMPAAAGDFGLQIGVNVGGRDSRQVGINLAIGQHRSVVPVQRVWIPPTYKVVTERVWVPTIQTAYRDIPVINPCGQVVGYRREPYTIQSGFWKEVHRQVLVREGYWSGTLCAAAGQRRYPAMVNPERPTAGGACGAAHAQPNNLIAPTCNTGGAALALMNQPHNNPRMSMQRQYNHAQPALTHFGR